MKKVRKEMYGNIPEEAVKVFTRAEAVKELGLKEGDVKADAVIVVDLRKSKITNPTFELEGRDPVMIVSLTSIKVKHLGGECWCGPGAPYTYNPSSPVAALRNKAFLIDPELPLPEGITATRLEDLPKELREKHRDMIFEGGSRGNPRVIIVHEEFPGTHIYCIWKAPRNKLLWFIFEKAVTVYHSLGVEEFSPGQCSSFRPLETIRLEEYEEECPDNVNNWPHIEVAEPREGCDRVITMLHNNPAFENGLDCNHEPGYHYDGDEPLVILTRDHEVRVDTRNKLCEIGPHQSYRIERKKAVPMETERVSLDHESEWVRIYNPDEIKNATGFDTKAEFGRQAKNVTRVIHIRRPMPARDEPLFVMKGHLPAIVISEKESVGVEFRGDVCPVGNMPVYFEEEKERPLRRLKRSVSAMASNPKRIAAAAAILIALLAVTFIPSWDGACAVAVDHQEQGYKKITDLPAEYIALYPKLQAALKSKEPIPDETWDKLIRNFMGDLFMAGIEDEKLAGLCLELLKDKRLSEKTKKRVKDMLTLQGHTPPELR